MKHWWEDHPWRMVQTNLREIDMDNIDAVAYAKDLKDFGATVVTLNAAGIIASYNSKLPYHPNSEYLTGDSLDQIIEACHNEGIRVIARTDFSKIKESVFKEHPEWAYRTREGNIVSYNGNVHTCPNGDYQQKYMFDILEEVLTTYDFDGLFCNMSGFLVVDYSYNYHGPCHCDSCKTKFIEQYGLELPEKDDFRDPAYKKYMIFKKNSEREQTRKLHELVKGINPEIAINKLDYVRCESNTEIGRPQWQYSASSNSRVISGPGRARPTDNASVDFMGFRYRQISVSPELMALRQWQNLANAGSLSYYIMGTLGNHADTSSIGPTKEVFHFHKENEQYYSNLTSAAKVVLVRKALWQDDPETFGWIRALTESHIPFDEIRLEEINDIEQLNEKEIVILGDMKFLSDEQVKLFDEFAANGGTVIATGETGLYTNKYEARKGMSLQCLGIDKVKEVKKDLMSSMYMIPEEEKETFPRCDQTPYIAFGTNLVLTTIKENVKGYLRLIPEHAFGPPELCYYDEISQELGIMVSDYHKGKGIYIPWSIGAFYRNEGYQNTLNIIQDIMFSLCNIDELAPDLTPMVEINLAKNKDTKMIQLVNNSGVFANSYFKPLPVYNIKLKIKLSENESNDIRTLSGGKVKTTYENGYVQIILDKLENYEAIIM